MNKITLNIALLTVMGLTLSGCGIYAKYKTPEIKESEKAFGEITSTDTTSLADIHWQQFFEDETLRKLIDTALVNNADMQNAMLKVREAQASYKASKLAFFPSVGVSPQVYYSGSFNVELPATASWQIDAFGALRNAKRGTKAYLEQSQEYSQAVQTQLIAMVAIDYYSLSALDAQLKVYEETEELWRKNVEVTRALMAAGVFNSASLSQTEANYYNICTSVVEIKTQIKNMENTICRLLGKTPQTIARGDFYNWKAPESLSVGVPAKVLASRPDVRQAEQSLVQAFYGTAGARSALYPTITISGSADFYGAIYGVAASLTQPLFQRGKLKANLEIAKAQQDAAMVNFRQAIIDAGIEVNDAFLGVNNARDKSKYYTLRVESLEKAVESTRLLMNHGSTTYLEVLVAQQSLLTAQIGSITNSLSEITSVITLYQSLGGGIL